MILDFMQTTSEKLAGGWQFPETDVTIVTGWGMHSRGRMEQPAIIRDVTLRFLQVCYALLCPRACLWASKSVCPQLTLGVTVCQSLWLW